MPGTSLRFTIRAVTVPKGKLRARSLALSDAQREEIGKLSAVSFRVRLSPPAGSKRFIEVWVRAHVPAQLRAASS